MGGANTGARGWGAVRAKTAGQPGEVFMLLLHPKDAAGGSTFALTEHTGLVQEDSIEHGRKEGRGSMTPAPPHPDSH